MIAIITLLIIIILSILITRIATVALVHTGLSMEVARFQARSAFTGVGFTTNESENVVNHPLRRRIFMLLMLFGNAGIVTVIASVVLTFMNLENTQSFIWRVGAIFAGLVLLWFLSSNRWVSARLSMFIAWGIRRYTHLDVRDYASLLHVAGEYKVTELFVEKVDWLANKRLIELRLQDEGIMILGITRSDGTYLGAPDGSTEVYSGDTLILYGREPAFVRLDQRQKGRNGDLDHQKAVDEQEKVIQEEKREDVTKADD